MRTGAELKARLKKLLHSPEAGNGGADPARPDSHEIVWLDRTDAVERSNAAPTPELRGHALDLIQRGATKVGNAISPDVCDAVVDDYRAFCREHVDGDGYLDERGFHPRLANFHLVSESALQIGLNPRLLEVIDFLMGYRASVWSSLTFEIGTQQRIHSDEPYFVTNPPGFFLGVWTALEDISPEAGPLTYWEGGHRNPIEPLAPVPDEGDRHDAYLTRIDRWCAEAGLSKVVPEMRKGDTLLWHPRLPHGGSAIRNPSLTRKSIVFHYKPEDVPLFGPAEFFDPSLRTWQDHHPYAESKGRRLAAGATQFER